MKFAIIGCQHYHIKSFIEEMLAEGHQFAGIFDDSDYEVAVQCAASYSVPFFSTLEEVLEQEVGLIGSAGPNDRKIDVIEWAEKHGIHVMTDKPIVIDENGLSRLRQVIDRNRIKVGMMLTARFAPAQFTLKHMIDEGLLGEIEDFTFLKPHKLNPASRPAWFFDKAINGGLIIDLMIHDVDMLWWFTGKKIVSHNGMLVKKRFPEYPSLYENAIVNVVLEDHITATMKSDWLMPEAFESWGDGRIFVSGTKGRVELRVSGDPFGQPGPFVAFTDHHHKTTRLEIIKPPATLAADFLNQIAGKPHRLTMEDVYRANSAVLKIDRASAKLSVL
jgi:predicted dehydrogenase